MKIITALFATLLFCACATNSHKSYERRETASTSALEEQLKDMLGEYKLVSNSCSIGAHRSSKGDTVKVNFYPREIETHFGQKVDTGDWITFQVIDSKIPDHIDERGTGAQGVMISSDYKSHSDKNFENLERSASIEGQGKNLEIVSRQSYVSSAKQYNHVRTIKLDGKNLEWSVAKTPGYRAETCKFLKISE